MIQNLLPENFLVPGTAMKFDLTNAIRGLRGMPRSVLLAGFTNISSPELLVGAAVKITSEKQVIALAGEYSVLHQMYTALPAIVRLSMPVYIYRMDASIGTKAQKSLTITFAGTLTADLAITVLCNGYRIPVVLPAGSDQEDVAAAISAAITADSVKANATSSVATNVVTVTCAFGGFESDDMVLCVEGFEKSSVAIDGLPNIVTPGAGDQDISTLTAFLAQQRITQIAWPGKISAANYLALGGFLLDMWAPENQRDTQLLDIITCIDVSAATTALNERNNHQIASLCVSAYLTTPVWKISAAVAGLVEYSAAIDPAKPYRDSELVGLAPPSNDFDKAERNSILRDGGSTLISSDGRLYIERIVTNYTQNASSVEDASYRNLEWIKTMSWWRWFITTEFGLKYRNYKMAEVWDPAFANQKIMTIELGEEVILGCYRQAINAGLMQDMDGYQQDLVVEVAGASGRLKYQEKPRLVTQHYQTEVTSEPILGSLS